MVVFVSSTFSLLTEALDGSDQIFNAECETGVALCFIEAFWGVFKGNDGVEIDKLDLVDSLLLIDNQEEASATNLVHVLLLREFQNLVKLLNQIVAAPLTHNVIIVGQHYLKQIFNLLLEQLHLVNFLEHMASVHVFLAVADDPEAMLIARALAVLFLASFKLHRVLLVTQSLRHG